MMSPGMNPQMQAYAYQMRMAQMQAYSNQLRAAQMQANLNNQLWLAQMRAGQMPAAVPQAGARPANFNAQLNAQRAAGR
jgi:hypothetical protein